MRVIPLRYDVAFKKAFGQKDIFCQFVEDVLGIKINIDEVHREYKPTEPVGKVKVAFDLYAEDKEQKIIVELQHIKHSDFFDRFLYYHLVGLVEQVSSYQDYSFDKTVYTIVVLTNKPKEEDPSFSMGVCDMPIIDEHGKSWSLYKHRLVFLNPHHVNNKTPPSVRKWLELVEDSLDEHVELSDYQEPLLQQLLHSIQKEELSPEELSIIKDEAAWENTKKEAQQQGLQQGRKEGEKISQLKIAKTLLESGMELSKVAVLVKLSEEEISSFVE